jgi:triphosphatase
MKRHAEIELKFQVPASARKALAAAMARGSASLARTSLVAMYLDTADRRLARAGLAWRLRREGRRWVQTLKAGGAHALERFEHEAIRPDASCDASEHRGTPQGDRLLALLRSAAAAGQVPVVRYRTEVRRTSRRVRTKGAVVDIAFDEGRLLAGTSSMRIREIEFELVSGSTIAMLALAERWRQRFGLLLDPCSKSERGDRLAEGCPHPALRKARPLDYPGRSTTDEAFATVIDECLGQILRNGIGLADGDPASRGEHVHQMRVGIRRLRSALRFFDGWVQAPPAGLVANLRVLFETLGQSRERDVLDSGIVAELVKAGAPTLHLPADASAPDPSAAVRSNETQRLLLAWTTWRASLDEQPLSPHARDATSVDEGAASQTDVAAAGTAAVPDGSPDTRPLWRLARRRLRRWHERIVADWARFDELDESGLHALRKRIKRQRYAVEFVAPVMSRRSGKRYLSALATIQELMGELNDLFGARQRYQALVATEPAAWFALGWLAARISEVRAQANQALGRVARTAIPSR